MMEAKLHQEPSAVLPDFEENSRFSVRLLTATVSLGAIGGIVLLWKISPLLCLGLVFGVFSLLTAVCIYAQNRTI